MKSIFITATNTDIGKTYATLKLLEEFSRQGYRVGAFKPIETGVNSHPQDAKKLLQSSKKLNPDFNAINIDDICPLQFSLPAAPYVANNGEKIDLKKIKKSYTKLKKYCDILLIEGAGGLMVPIDREYFMIDFIELFNSHTLLVTHDKLGSINDTLLSLEALKNRNLPHTWCINNRHFKEDFEKITLPFYKKEFERVLMLEDIKTLCLELIAKSNSNSN